MKLLFCFLCCFLWSAVDADGACFRRYDHQTKACKGLLFGRSDIQPLMCCERYGQGYAQLIIRVESRKKWFECTSCKGFDQSVKERESNPDNSDGYESKEGDDDDDTNAKKKEVQQLNGGGRKLEVRTEEERQTTVAPPSIGRRRRPGTSSDDRRQKNLSSESRNNDSKDLTYARAQEEDDDNEEEEEVEREGNVKIEEQTEEENDMDEEEQEDNEEDGMVVEEKEDEDEDEEEEEGTDPSESEQRNKTYVSVDWSPWSDWSPCSHSCGVGVQKRRRFCLTSSCGEEFEERACQKLINCPVAGGWNAWTSWTACTVSCGNGTRTRMRPCLSPPPAHGGINCQGPTTEKELCFLPPCKVDGAWSAWSLWSVCSVTCDRGEQVRTRSCDQPEPAHGGNKCNGSNEERRDCDNLPCPVDGNWSNWTKWSNCSATCGEGMQTRSRTCDSPIPDHGGQLCDGPERETMPCVTRINCPVDGNWTEWSRWDICSAKPCSGQLGHRVRYRTCTNPRPMFGGRACRGRTWSRQACYNNDFCTQPVDGGWCDWVDWSSCAVGIQTRSRLCECPPPVNGGQDCPGINVEEKSCQSTDDVISDASTAGPIVPDETHGTTQSESRDCSDDESGDGSDVACADEDEEISADHSESTSIGDQEHHKI